ncbi:unnamed protein product [Caenorhabditis angaria]|uniref:Uncharacterized protein n=1 Tax=Caenorhabditis angaria TaxID=860376 RepID=A0A9P1IEG4_9PELO|nr:unnamed protein product [Caenorhabditis angaria]
MISPFFLIIFTLHGILSQQDELLTKNCKIEALGECSQSCGGGYRFFKWICVEAAENCAICPSQLMIYQCNNRPCLSKNATLEQIFDDAEDQNEELSSVEYYE